MINRVSLHTFCERLKSSDLFKDSFWALAGSALGKGLSLLAGIAVARFLGKEVYGEYGTIRTTLFYIAIVSTFGFGYTATKFVADYISEKPEKLKSLVWTFLKITLVFSGLLALVQIIFAASIALFIDAPNLEFQLRFFSLLIILNGYSGKEGLLEAGGYSVDLLKRYVSAVNVEAELICRENRGKITL